MPTQSRPAVSAALESIRGGNTLVKQTPSYGGRGQGTGGGGVVVVVREGFGGGESPPTGNHSSL